MEWHKYRPYELIGRFNTPNETVIEIYFYQYRRTRAVGHSEGETMARLLIESSKSARPNYNQDWNNADGLYPATMLTTGYYFYTNASKYHPPSFGKNEKYG